VSVEMGLLVQRVASVSISTLLTARWALGHRCFAESETVVEGMLNFWGGGIQ